MTLQRDGNRRRGLGICLGASNVKLAVLSEENGSVQVESVEVHNHESNPRAVFTKLLSTIDPTTFDTIGLTGRKFRDMVALPSITEPEAVEYALAHVRTIDKDHAKHYAAVASLGAENFVVYVLDREGNVASVETGNKCASGTGEFFLQQIGRMDIDTDRAVDLAASSEIYRVSGRCSVFCKSDCTHALNKGIPIGRVTAGLSKMMSEKVMDLLERIQDKKLIAVGGVTQNRVVMDYLGQSVDDLWIPPHAEAFEAVGAALYGLKKGQKPVIDMDHLFVEGRTSFSFLPPISQGEELVDFKESNRGVAKEGDECVVGLDVGSTTTKAVVVRLEDDAVLASVYLRTNGNPVGASRQCYRELISQLGIPVKLVGLATTGSGRQIAGLHAGTDNIINEIIAHATGAAHFDKEVDTIFEIGGQDAKYTYLTNAVPSDYAMNEACSAGTGSFLEESAKESLGIDFRSIADIAVQGTRPPNFNDQCAAFISSDIKTATHEGIGREDIVAGLVYSICMNYVNRVKGQRRAGTKIFMQGGVCYNRAVPLAMANLIGKPIVVPPDPGLIGAFGVALELKDRLASGLANRASVDLAALADREIEFGKRFTCAGGKEKCDRGCEINMIVIDGKKYPFGGACNKYYNQVHHLSFDAADFDFAKKRQELLFQGHATESVTEESAPTIGISRSYLTNNFYPLYHKFFTELGFRIVLSDDVDSDGIKRKRSAFCYPGEIAHGCLANLLKKETDYLFLPVIVELHVENSVSSKKEHQCTCMLMQSEAYWLKSAFRGKIDEQKVLSPVVNFRLGFESQATVFADLAQRLGRTRKQGMSAYQKAVNNQRAFNAELRRIGSELLSELAKDPQKTAIVLFGRTYNAFADEGNLGIPTKFASRGITVIPWDFLPIENEPCDENMCWANGQFLLRASSFVKNNPQLFGAFITNFSCGPDSFLLGYFRDIMKTKPSLTLELDSHTADAGVNTRIEAFLDIVTRYRELGKQDDPERAFTPARVDIRKKGPVFVTSEGGEVSLFDPRVHVLMPAMGRFTSQLLAATLRGGGIRASCADGYDFEVLKVGRANSSCKECLPLQLTVGGLMEYMANRTDPDEMLVYFMPTATGNCRFTQYSVFLNNLIRKHQYRNVALLTLTTENSYAGMPNALLLNALKAIVVSDVIDDIFNTLNVLAVDKEKALVTLDNQWVRIVDVFEKSQGKGLYRVLEDVARELKQIPLRYPLSEAKVVALLGEIFVRRTEFACQDIADRLARRDIILRRAPVFEWMKYIDQMVVEGVYEPDFTMKDRLEFWGKMFLQNRYENSIKKALAQSGLYEPERIDVKKLLNYGKNFFDLDFTGESILVAGSFFKEILHSVQGVISIGPFACMPTRVIEAVLSAESNLSTKLKLDKRVKNAAASRLEGDSSMSLPFLSIESDGNPFPQIVEARVEAFCLQVERMHQRITGKHEMVVS